MIEHGVELTEIVVEAEVPRVPSRAPMSPENE